MDKRQRAMLKEMGVRVWQPLPDAPKPLLEPLKVALTEKLPAASPANKVENATDSGAVSARIHSASASFNSPKQALQALQAVPAAAQAENTALAWRVGTAQTLYADTAGQTAARWLVLIEAPASALQDFKPLDGDAGKLLDNMLRAAKLHTAFSVRLAPLVRAGAIGTGGDLPGAIAEVLASAKADVVLVMGRLAAQALLQSTEPLAKLRGRVHSVQGQQTVITIDPTYLLRNPLDKAKAWDDLCLAINLSNAISTS